MKQLSPEWFEARKGRITASMVGAILGLSPYMTREDAMRSMVRDALGAEREFQGNVATDWGQNNEAGALIDYRIETTHEVEEVGFVPHADWAGISPDGLIGDKGGVEIKCPYSLRKAEAPVQFKSLQEQPHYYAQVQFSLWVTGRQWWHFYQWAPNGNKLQAVRPDKDWLDEAIGHLYEFHKKFLSELENNPDEYLQPKRVQIDTPQAYKMAAEWDELNEAIERATERKRDLLDEIVGMTHGKDAVFAGRKITNVERKGAVSYAKVVKQHCPDVDLEPFRGKPSNYWKLT